jgi:hypothetical protein
MHRISQVITPHRTLVIPLLCFISVIAFAQEWSHQLSFGFGNNGQVSSVQQEFYFVPDAYNPADDVSDFSESRSCWELAYAYRFKSGIGVRLQYTHANRVEEYTITNNPGTGSTKQAIRSFAPGVFYFGEAGRFIYSSGIELSHFTFEDCIEHFQFTSSGVNYIGTRTMEGGTANGISGVIVLGIRVWRYASISLETRAGLFWYNLGGKYVESYTSSNGSAPQSRTWPQTYVINEFSPPSFSLKVGLLL